MVESPPPPELGEPEELEGDHVPEEPVVEGAPGIGADEPPVEVDEEGEDAPPPVLPPVLGSPELPPLVPEVPPLLPVELLELPELLPLELPELPELPLELPELPELLPLGLPEPPELLPEPLEPPELPPLGMPALPELPPELGAPPLDSLSFPQPLARSAVPMTRAVSGARTQRVVEFSVFITFYLACQRSECPKPQARRLR